jgi:hypothetical protein
MNFVFMRETKETFYLKSPFLGNLEIVTIEVISQSGPVFHFTVII